MLKVLSMQSVDKGPESFDKVAAVVAEYFEYDGGGKVETENTENGLCVNDVSAAS